MRSFTDAFNKKLSTPSKWFCLGGSYPGSLAAWYRATYPDRVEGCVASSAPVLAKEDFYEYGQVVWRALASGGHESTAQKLHVGYSGLADALAVSTPLAHQQLMKELNLCPYSVLSRADRAGVEQISVAFSEVVQYNNSMPPGQRIEDYQKVIAAASTPLEAAMNVTKLLRTRRCERHGGCQDFGDCQDFSLRGMYEALSNTSTDGDGAAARAWFYQTCNEFGYFQTVRVADFPGRTNTLFTRGVANPSLWQGVCERVFNIPASDVAARIRETNLYYGGLTPNVSRVFYINGEFDPWAELSITTVPQYLQNQDVHAMIVDHGSHCAGLESSQFDNTSNVQGVHTEMMRLAASWLDMPDIVV